MSTGRDYVYDVRTKRESARGVTETGSFVGHRCRAVDLGGLFPTGKLIEDTAAVPYLHDTNEEVVGSQLGGQWTTEEDLEGLPTALTAGASYASPNNSCIETVKQAFGGSFGAAGSAIVAGGGTTTASILDLTVGHGVRFVPGSVGFATTTSGPGNSAQLELFHVRKVVGDALHLSWALASAPAALSVIYNSETCYLDPAGVGLDTYSVYGEVIGEDASDQWKMRGCAPTIDVIGQWDEIIAMQVSYMCATASGPVAHGLTLGETSPTGGGRKAIAKRIVYMGDVTDADSAATRGVLEPRSVSVHPNLNLITEDGGGIEGSYAHHQGHADPRANFEVSVMRGSAAYADYFVDTGARQAKYFAVQWGTQVASSGRGGIIFAVMPRCRFSAVAKRSSANGLVQAELELGGTRPLMYTGGTTAIVRSPILFGVA